MIELLVTISLIAVLSAIGLVTYSKAQISGRDTKRRSDLAQVRSALELYYQKNDAYPAGAFDSCSSSGSDNWSNFVTLISPFINKVPVDPQNTASGAQPGWYCYYYTSQDPIINPTPTNPTSFYVLGARLEAAPYSDPSQCPGPYYNYCPGSGCSGYHDISSGVNNFYGACSVNYVIIGN